MGVLCRPPQSSIITIALATPLASGVTHLLLGLLWTWTTPWSSIYLRSSLPSPSDSSLEFLSLLAPFAPWTLRSSDSLSCNGSGSRMVVVVVESRGSGSGNGRGSSSGSGSVRVTVVVVVWGCWWCGVVGGRCGVVGGSVVFLLVTLHYIALHYTVAHRSALYCIRYTTLHHIAVYDITLHYITLSYRTLLTFDPLDQITSSSHIS